MNTPQFVTEGAASYAAEVSDPSGAYYRFAMRRGASCLRRAEVRTDSPDMRLLAYLVWRGMSDLVHQHRSLDDDYVVAGDVLDRWVTDHDAELLCEIVPEVNRELGPPVGGLTVEVTAVHAVLLHVAGAIREAWEGGRV